MPGVHPPTGPLVTVVMPVKDAADFLSEAVDSVLRQTWAPLELVIVDDGGTDGSDDLAQQAVDADPRVRLVRHEGRANRGIGPSRALGVRHAEGDLVAFLDADDVWEADHLDRTVRLLLDHPAADVVCGRVWEWRSWSDPALPDTLSGLAFAPGVVVPGVRLLAAVLRHGGLATATCALLARRDLLTECLEHLDRFPGMYEDQAMNSSLQLRGTVVMSGSTTAWYRQHPASFSAVDAARAERHDSGRTFFLTWLRAEVDRLGTPDPELSRLVDRALGDVHRYVTGPSTGSRRALLERAVPGLVRRGAGRARRELAVRMRARAAAAARAGRLEELLSRYGADVRGDVLVLAAPGIAAPDGLPAAQPWPGTGEQRGPRSAWAALPTAGWDCVLAVPGRPADLPDRSGLRHLHRALRPGGTLLVATTPPAGRRLLPELQVVFGWTAVGVDVESSGGPRDVPLVLHRAVTPAG